MLTKLPFEVSCNIIQHLETSELLVCLQTCHEWNNFIKKRQLIRELEPETTDQFISVLQAVERQYINGNQITSLKIESAISDIGISFNALPRLFPKLKTFENEGNISMMKPGHFITGESAKAFQQWESSLEKLKIYGDISEVVPIFETCHFERLTDLDLGYYDLDNIDSNLTSILEDRFIVSLKHLPQLTSLVLRGEVITFQSLELLHDALPSLEKLELVYSTLPFPLGIPQDITPAEKLTHLTIQVMQFHKNEQYTLQYVLAKYPNLTHLHLSHDFNVDTLLMAVIFQVISVTIDPVLLAFVPQLPPTLTAFRNQLICTTKPLIDALDASPSLSNLSEFYLWYDERLHHQSATLEYCYSKNRFQSLDRLWMKGRRITDIYPDTEMVTNLRKLDFTSDFECADNAREMCHLDRVFKTHPLLEELSISALGYRVDADNDRSSSSAPLHVRELYLEVGSISDLVIPFISNRMPNLKRLSILLKYDRKEVLLDSEEEEDEEEKEERGDQDKTDENKERCYKRWKQTIELPGHQLEHIELKMNEMTNNILCSVNSIIEDQKKYYCYFEKDSKVKYCGMNPPFIEKKEDEIDYYIHIDCKSLRHLTVNGIKLF